MPLYVRHLNPKEYGAFSMLMIALSLLTIVLSFGFNQAFFRQYYDSDDPERRRKVVGSATLFLTVSSALLLTLLYPFSGLIADKLLGLNAGRTRLVQMLLLICFFEVITLIPDAILRAHFKSARYSLLNITALAFQLGAIAYLVLFVDASANGVILGRLAGTAFEAIIFFAAVRSELSFAFSKKELMSMLAFGSPLILGQLLSTLFVMVDRFFVERYGALRDVGIYALSNSIVSIITILVITPFGQVWNVMRFSVMNEDDAHEYYSRVLTYIVLVSMFIALCVSAVVGDGLILKAGGYAQAARLIPMLALAAVFDSGSRVLNVGITVKNKTVFSPVVTGIALSINICLNFLLIPRYGPMGASISTLLSFIAFCAIRFAVSNRFFKVSYDWARVFTATATGASIVLAYYLIDDLRGDSPAPSVVYFSIVIKVALAFSFPAALFVIGFYDERERRKLSEVARESLAVLRLGRAKI